MCRVYNTIGCLTAIREHLQEHNVNEYQSLNELIDFQKGYPVAKQRIISSHRLLIERERSTLSVEVVQLNDNIRTKKTAVKQQLLLNLKNITDQLSSLPAKYTNVIQAILGWIKKIWLTSRIKVNKLLFNFRIARSVRDLVSVYNERNTRYQFIISNPEEAIMQSGLTQLQELDRRKDVIDQINNSIYGALGEQKVVDVLKRLGDDCILINDFKCKFNPAIFNKKETDYIKSVQIDHILITPSGVFLIETKNWSQQSINNLNLYSPVQQIKRASFALFRILNGNFNRGIALKKHHWGDRKIPIRNLVVLINYKPIEEFKHVKILILDNLLGYVNYFEPYFSYGDTHIIANYLLGISGN